MAENEQTLNRNRYVDQRNHCPFDCGDGQLNENGYCCHLVGFTNDGKVLEKVIYDPGRVRVSGKDRERVQKTDQLVNPLKTVADEQTGRVTKFNEWVSSRVYRQVAPKDASAWREKHLTGEIDEPAEEPAIV